MPVKSNTKVFIEKAMKKFPHFDYSLVNYDTQAKQVSIKCNTHGVFQTTPKVFLKSKCGCPNCGFDRKEEAKYSYICKECKKPLLNKDRYMSPSGKSIPYHPDCKKIYERKYNLKKTFNIDFEEFEKMFKDQNSKCKICLKDLELLDRHTHLDHCHESGKVRGILCKSCNNMLGYAKDNTETLKNAVLYLEENKV